MDRLRIFLTEREGAKTVPYPRGSPLELFRRDYQEST